MNYHIRKLKNSEESIKKAKKFLFKMIKEEYGYDYTPEFHYDIKNLKETYLDSKSSRNTFLIAENDNNEIIGTIAIREYDKKFIEFKNRYSSENTASIWRLFVDKKYRRKGIASELVKKIEEFAEKKEFEEIYLHTHKNINGALEFWTYQNYNIILDTNNELQTVHMEKLILNNLIQENQISTTFIEAK